MFLSHNPIKKYLEHYLKTISQMFFNIFLAIASFIQLAHGFIVDRNSRYSYHSLRRQQNALRFDDKLLSEPTEDNGVVDFFQNGQVGNVLGGIFERNLYDTLENAEYKSFLHEDYQGPGLSTEFLRHNPLFGQKGTKIGQVDALVSGKPLAFERLCELCPVHYIPEGAHIADVNSRSAWFMFF